MKIIFLDVDGELTYSDYENPDTANIDIEKVKLLKQVCDGAGAKVVISSSWRGTPNGKPHIYHVLTRILAENGIEVLGDLPYIDSVFEKPIQGAETSLFDEALYNDLKIAHGTGRAAEVEAWLKEHDDVESFVILDDEDWDWSDYGYEKNWIRPTWHGDGGLKPEHAEQAILILNRK